MDEESGKTLEEELRNIIFKDSLLTEELQSYFKVMSSLEPVKDEEIQVRKVGLKNSVKPKYSDKTLILDLDDTLAHTLLPNVNYSTWMFSESEIKNTSYIDAKSGLSEKLKVVIRPCAIDMLKQLYELYEIVVNASIRFLQQLRESMQML